MDLTDDIRCDLYNWIKKDLNSKRSEVVDKTISEMREIVAALLIERIGDKAMEAARSIPGDQIQYYRNISLTKESLDISKNELFDKISRTSRRYYNYYISINMEKYNIRQTQDQTGYRHGSYRYQMNSIAYLPLHP